MSKDKTTRTQRFVGEQAVLAEPLVWVSKRRNSPIRCTGFLLKAISKTDHQC
ncbi:MULTISPECIES: hypothetical protein [unclassified Pseudomonas]|uniref:hypothetical protein n=1 Tax=unclassified Pseudomonas TaxID=196821 RepID=UPI001FD054D9|nr:MULTISPECIES: hypothetical protein [unclassified Pseudomonas]